MSTRAGGTVAHDGDVPLDNTGPQRRRRRDGRLPRVHARAVQPLDHPGRRLRALDARRRRDGRGVERLVRARLPRARQALETDRRRARSRSAQYVNGTATGVRVDAIDCPVSVAADALTASAGRATPTTTSRSAHSEHADGEIWGQTLWELRDATRPDAAPATSSPRRCACRRHDPSFLDMRNAILQADLSRRRATEHTARRSGRSSPTAAWASSRSRAAATRPRASTSTPPARPRVTVTGKGHRRGQRARRSRTRSSSFRRPARRLTDTTDAAGNYSIPGMIAGHLPGSSRCSAPGREIVDPRRDDQRGQPRDQPEAAPNLAAASGGATASTAGPDFTGDGCGPRHLIDGSRQTGWGSTSPGVVASGPKSVTIALRQAIQHHVLPRSTPARCAATTTARPRAGTDRDSSDGLTFTLARRATSPRPTTTA